MKVERTAVQKVYQIAETPDRQALLEFLTQHGQQLLPFVELIADARMAVDEFIDVLGRASLEAVLQLSAGTVAGPPHQGKAGGEVRRHGSQAGGEHAPLCRGDPGEGRDLWGEQVEREPGVRRGECGKAAGAGRAPTAVRD